MPNVPQVSGLSIYRGDTFSLKIKFWEDDDKTIPSDVSGRSFLCQMRIKANEDPAIDCDIDTSDGGSGIITIGLSNEVTSEMSGSKYFCDFEQTTDGVVKTLWQAKIPVKPDVSR